MEAPGGKSANLPRSNDDMGFVFPTVFTLSQEDNAYPGCPREPMTLVEVDLLRLRASIMRKERWADKLDDAGVVQRWRREAAEQGAEEEAVDFVLDELRHLASLRQGPIEPAVVDGVWQADGIVDGDLTADLLSGVAKLEDVPEEARDWHPGSDNQVLDLVHPSLFPFVAGVSRQTEIPEPWDKFVGTGEVQAIDNRPNWDLRGGWHSLPQGRSKAYQWLPAEFAVLHDGSVAIESYINNLHPLLHPGLYRTIGAIFGKFVPLFERVLTDALSPRLLRVVPQSCDYSEVPPVPAFKAPDAPEQSVNLHGRKLQVIVKLANIVLTPDKPSYSGGAWHVEGMENEAIVATGIFYYAQDNIAESRLAFRQAVSEPDYEQCDDEGVMRVYGMENEGPLNQNLGSVITVGGRCLAFPNMLQHRVTPFCLKDATQPGYRKILVFFLVDPCRRVLSTATVPPQQRGWLKMEIAVALRGIFPQTITDRVSKAMDWPVRLEEAKRHREELMKERKFFVNEATTELFEREFSLCEH